MKDSINEYDKMIVNCPLCKKEMRIPSNLNIVVSCPFCNNNFNVNHGKINLHNEIDKKILQQKIINLLRISPPIKARQLTTILGEEFGMHIDLSDINSVLYSMKAKGIAKNNQSYKWSLLDNKLEKSAEQSEYHEYIEPEIKFTSEQQSIINLDPADHLLIRGQAGSGKTTVLAARAGRILSAMNYGNLLFLTYNNALCAYVKAAFVKNGMKGDIDVRTFHNWAKTTSKLLGYNFTNWVDSKQRSNKLREIIAQSKIEIGNHRLYKFENTSDLIKWWSEEIAWLFGQHITHLNDYLTVDRIGRGTSIKLSQEDRRFVWFVYEAYQEWLEENHQEDYDNPAGLILRALMEQNMELPDNLRYDHVLIDEVQDFDKSWLLAVIKIPKVSLTLAGDIAQKIYKRNFTWSSVGIQVRGGRSKHLSLSHRTTKQIMDVANYLLIDNNVIKSEDYIHSTTPNKSDEKVKIIISQNAKNAYDVGYDWIAMNFKNMRTKNIVVALPFSNQLYPSQNALKKRGLNATIAKGQKLGKMNGGVAITTYHQLKGLEFDHVIIMGLHDAQYPGRLLMNIPQEDHIEEEQLMKRILYVAMTRAKNSVTLVGSKPFCRFFNNVPHYFFEFISDEKIASRKSEITKISSHSRDSYFNKKTPSPRPLEWSSNIPELSKFHFKSWKAICDHLNIDVGSNSARRVLKKYVNDYQSHWPAVPGLDSDYE